MEIAFFVCCFFSPFALRYLAETEIPLLIYLVTLPLGIVLVPAAILKWLWETSL